jgi:hypothetical protein
MARSLSQKFESLLCLTESLVKIPLGKWSTVERSDPNLTSSKVWWELVELFIITDVY